MPNRDQNSFLDRSREACPCGNGIEFDSAEKGRAWGRFKKRSYNTAIGIMLMAMALPSLASQSVELAWNPSKSPNIVGYNVYYGGASNDYPNKISVRTLTNMVVSGLADGAIYYFAVKAVNSSGIESGFSTPISYAVPTAAAILERPVFSSNGVSITVTGVPGYLYEIQVSTNMVNWTSLEISLTPLRITDNTTSQYKRRFYRAVYLH
jgi:hypothetical protein